MSVDVRIDAGVDVVGLPSRFIVFSLHVAFCGAWFVSCCTVYNLSCSICFHPERSVTAWLKTPRQRVCHSIRHVFKGRRC